MKQIHYLLVGYPFAGKTTFAKKLAKRFDFVRLSIDEVKFESGYKDISDNDVPDKAWQKIFDELDRRIIQNLKDGKTIVNEYAWLTKVWRNRAKKLADDLGIETQIIFIDTSEQTVRERWQKNKEKNERFDIPNDVFEEAIKLFENPMEDENVLVYKENDDLNEWAKENIA